MSRVQNLTDFRGGYYVDTPHELAAPNECQLAENCWWQEKLAGRQGHSSNADLTSYSNCMGFKNAKINDIWYTIAALDDGSNVNFYHAASNVYTLIDSALNFTQDKEVDFAIHRDKVIAVNGTEKPAIIYYDSLFIVKDLEQYAVVTRGDSDWAAGQYVDSNASYTDDTTDAQSTGSTNDFSLATTTASNGLFIACDYTFTKIIFKDAEQFTGSPVASYQYYKGNSTWGTLTMETTPTWTAATGDKTMEFAWPSDWEAWDGTEATMVDRYVIRIRFTTAPDNSPSADYLQVYHTHYLTQIMENERPQAVGVHQAMIWMAAGNNVQYCAWNDPTNWPAYQVEYFLEGGSTIKKLISFKDNLVVFKEDAIYGLFGNVYTDAVKRKLLDIGTKSGRSVAEANGTLFFMGNDGHVRGFNGEYSYRLSKHIKSDLDGYTQTNACAVNYQGYYLLSFPSNAIILLFDPDSFRILDEASREGRMSFYKWKTCVAHGFMLQDGDGQAGALLAIDNTARKLIQYQNGNGYDDTETTIDVKLKTKPHSQGAFLTNKVYQRVKIDISKAGAWTLTIEGSYGTQTQDVTIASGSGTGHFKDDYSIPSKIDGHNIALQLRNNTVNAAEIFGMAVEYVKRSF